MFKRKILFQPEQSTTVGSILLVLRHDDKLRGEEMEEGEPYSAQDGKHKAFVLPFQSPYQTLLIDHSSPSELKQHQNPFTCALQIAISK